MMGQTRSHETTVLYRQKEASLEVLGPKDVGDLADHDDVEHFER